MKQYSTFIFESYHFDPSVNEIALNYSLDGEVHFTEKLTLPALDIASVPNLDNALFALHLAGGTSYYKTCCPSTIRVKSGLLNIDQADFWDTVYTKGLGEFFYQNEIDFRDLIHFPVHQNAPAGKDNTGEMESGDVKVLVPIGGGKDSIVTIEKLRKAGADITLLRMGKHPLIDQMVEITGLPCITIGRQLDGELFKLNAGGALNGHIPITAYLSALCTVLAKLYGFDAIALSNEKSANEGNTEYLGEEINHQWSKSEEFENLFQEYVRKYIDPGLHYYSPLRQMTELEIVGEFVQYPEYFSTFTSCNKNWKIAGERPTNRWCGTCPKCAFAFCLLAAYLPETQLTEIFDANLYENPELTPLYKQLLGLEGFKPFECVGTPEETKEAFAMAHQQGDFEDDVIMRLYNENCPGK